MQEKYQKYAQLLLIKGLCIKAKQPLVINAPIEAIDFVRVLTAEACKLGVEDIYFDWSDDELKHTELKYLNPSSIKKSQFWHRTIHDKYARKNAAFLFLISSNDNIMEDIDPKKIRIAAKESLKTRKIYRKLQEDNQVSWCIAAVATYDWAKLIYKKSQDPKTKLWNTIFDTCLINETDPCKAWTQKMQINQEICDKLNHLNIKTMHYTNSLGTNLTIELSKRNRWCGGSSKINGEYPIVNIPTEEVFTTPKKSLTEGIVYCSKPLIHSGVKITDICLKFHSGKVIEYYASKGLTELKNIIEYDKESLMLGEVALVDKNSKISATNTLFYETLFDENASCHIALGRGFKECLEEGDTLTEEELIECGYNQSNNHVDIMIGTPDLNIDIETYSGEKLRIFENGSFKI